MTERPLLYDLFCGAGGAAMGYQRAGFKVIGVDNKPQKNYPFEFIQMDALEFLQEVVDGKRPKPDVIHASPPCQKFSRIQSLGKARNGAYPEHLNFIEPTRNLLLTLNVPYVFENVPGAPLQNPMTLCGKAFDLHVYRHRNFESTFPLLRMEHFKHRDNTPSAGNGKSDKGFISVCGSGGVRGMNNREILSYWSYAMKINWMTRAELAQAIPPAYCYFIGTQLLSFLLGGKRRHGDSSPEHKCGISVSPDRRIDSPQSKDALEDNGFYEHSSLSKFEASDVSSLQSTRPLNDQD